MRWTSSSKTSSRCSGSRAARATCSSGWGRGRPSPPRARPRRLRTSRSRFPLFLGVGRMNDAQARVAAGETGAVADILAGIALSAGTGNQSGAPGVLTVLAEAYLTVGQLADARGAVAAGLAVAAQTGQRLNDAFLHGLEGEILRKTVEGSAVENEQAAEESFRRAIEIAREQEAKLPELRATLSLARLWRDQGKREPARDLLAPVYAWFTEGFDMLDLVEAKALLDELAR